MVKIDFTKSCIRGHVDRYPDGRCRACKIANAARRRKEKPNYQKEWYLANHEHALKTRREDYLKNQKRNLEYSKKHRAEHPEEVRQYNKKYKEENRGLMTYLQKKREIQRLRAMPKWLTQEDLVKIKLMYTNAVELTQQTGVLHHVDHIIPLRNKIVSGLHVPWNLRVISAKENLQKRNKLCHDLE